MIKNIFLGLGSILVLFLGFVALQPNEFYFSRSITINASSEKIFPLVEDLHHWQKWSPWAKLDPNAKLEYTGAQQGVGSSYTWDGNDQVGKGTMTIIETKVNELVRFRLDFEKPMKGTNEASFTFNETNDKTLVTWTMTGQNSFFGKLMKVTGLCERFMGEQFNKGLNQLKSLAEI